MIPCEGTRYNLEMDRDAFHEMSCRSAPKNKEVEETHCTTSCDVPVPTKNPNDGKELVHSCPTVNVIPSA